MYEHDDLYLHGHELFPWLHSCCIQSDFAVVGTSGIVVVIGRFGLSVETVDEVALEDVEENGTVDFFTGDELLFLPSC